MRSVTAETEIYYDPVIDDTVIEADQDMVQSYFILPDENGAPLESQSKWLLRLVLGRRQLLDKGLTVSDVAHKIKEIFGEDLAIIFSDDNADEQVIRIRMNRGGLSKEEAKEDAEIDDTLKRLETHMLDTVALRGIVGIRRVYVTFEERLREAADGTLIKSKSDDQCKEWYLDTDGINLKEVLTVPGVDATRTTCNHFGEINKVFGIEATRAALIRELGAVLSFDGSYVNHRHMALLCDVMTARGSLMAVTRHGINRADTGALMRCSFEETVEILYDAASAGELDDCRGISENVILGQLAPSGTGEFDVLLDQAMLQSVVSSIKPIAGISAGAASPEGAMTPYDSSPISDSGYGSGPDYNNAAFSPIVNAGADDSGGFTAYRSFEGGLSAYGGGTSPGYSGFAPQSPFGGISPASPGYAAGWSPSSPLGNFSPSSPAGRMGSPSSPAYAIASPAYASPSSPGFALSSPSYSPSSPSFGSSKVSPQSPSFSPSSPNAFSYSPSSPSYNQVSSPQYTPGSPLNKIGGTSPSYSPQSPVWSPASPQYTPSGSPGDKASPTSPRSNEYSPASPQWQPSLSPGSPKES